MKPLDVVMKSPDKFEAEQTRYCKSFLLNAAQMEAIMIRHIVKAKTLMPKYHKAIEEEEELK